MKYKIWVRNSDVSVDVASDVARYHWQQLFLVVSRFIAEMHLSKKEILSLLLFLEIGRFS